MQLGRQFRVEDYADLTDWCVRAPVTRLHCQYNRATDTWYPHGLLPRPNAVWVDAVEQCLWYCDCVFEDDLGYSQNGGPATAVHRTGEAYERLWTVKGRGLGMDPRT